MQLLYLIATDCESPRLPGAAETSGAFVIRGGETVYLTVCLQMNVLHIGREVIIMTSMLTARVDSEKRKIAEKVFSEIGLSTSAAINLFICAVAMNGGIPFPVGVNVHARGTFQRLQDRHERQNGIRLGLADGRYN